MENVKRTTQISSNIGRRCEHCDEHIGATDDGIAESINHYIDAHGYRLLHVGNETGRGRDGELVYHTIAVLGHDNPPAVVVPKVEILTLPEDMTTAPRGGTAPRISGTPKTK